MRDQHYANVQIGIAPTPVQQGTVTRLTSARDLSLNNKYGDNTWMLFNSRAWGNTRKIQWQNGTPIHEKLQHSQTQGWKEFGRASTERKPTLLQSRVPSDQALLHYLQRSESVKARNTQHQSTQLFNIPPCCVEGIRQSLQTQAPPNGNPRCCSLACQVIRPCCITCSAPNQSRHATRNTNPRSSLTFHLAVWKEFDRACKRKLHRTGNPRCCSLACQVIRPCCITCSAPNQSRHATRNTNPLSSLTFHLAAWKEFDRACKRKLHRTETHAAAVSRAK